MIKDLTWSDFAKVDMRVGTIVEARAFPNAKKPAYQIIVDFGPELGMKKSSSQITGRYAKEQLLGKQIVAVVNFPKKQIADFMSECVILGAVGLGDVILLQLETSVPNGLKIS